LYFCLLVFVFLPVHNILSFNWRKKKNIGRGFPCWFGQKTMATSPSHSATWQHQGLPSCMSYSSVFFSI
jgi:hypothetical protein